MDYYKAGFTDKDLRRAAPAAVGFGRQRRKILDEVIAPEYIDFLGRSRVPREVVHSVIGMVKSHGYVAGINDSKPFFVSNDESNAFAVVHPGRGHHRLNRGIRLILTHIDSPCLKLKTSPTLLPGAQDDMVLLPGVLLDAQNYGYIIPAHWMGRNLRLIGEVVSGGRTRRFELPVFSSIYAAHLKDKKEVTEDDLKLETGAQSVRELYELLGVNGEADFARLRSHVVPDEKPRLIGNGEFISGYGHDDKACVYAAVKALVESKPTSPCFVFGLDKEEIGSHSPNAAFSGFVRRVISETLARFSGNGRRTRPLEELIDRGLMKGVPAISADVDAGSGYFESQSDTIDGNHIAKVLHGPAIYVHGVSEGNAVTQRRLDYMVTLLDENLGPTRQIAERRYQITGSALNPSHSEPGETLARVFVRENIDVMDMGPPVLAVHNLSEELSSIDLYWTIQAYKAYFEERPSFRGGGRKKVKPTD